MAQTDDCVSAIKRYQQNIEKYVERRSEEKILYCMNRLSDLPIKVTHLEQTGVGRTVNALRKFDGVVSERAKMLISQWKKMVIAEQECLQDDDEEDGSSVSTRTTTKVLNEAHDKYPLPVEVASQHNEKESGLLNAGGLNDNVYKSKKPKKSKHKDVEHHSSHDRNKKPRDGDQSNNQPKRKHAENETVSGQLESKKRKIVAVNGIDASSGASFEEALGMCTTSGSRKLKSKKPTVPTREETQPVIEETEEVPMLLKEPIRESLDVNISSLLPAITPNYRPLGNIYTLESQQNKKSCSDYEQLSSIISSKTQRTKVYSGNKSSSDKVPKLFELCIRILQDNIDGLEFTGGVPFDVLKPILDKASATQLFNLENFNPYLIEDTDALWRLHCLKDFRNQKREEFESWREMYMRCLDEREMKLKILTTNIKEAQDKSLPVRTTKLAYVDTVSKPPRNIARKQRKYGTGAPQEPTPTARLAKHAAPPPAASKQDTITVPNPVKIKSSTERSSSSSATKTKKAPLMAKSLSLMKNRFRR